MNVIQPSCQAARIEPVARVAQRLAARLSTLEGFAFERMVREATEAWSRAGGDFTITDRVRGYWNRPNRERASVEIDFIAWNDHEKLVRFGSCKRNATKHNRLALRAFRENAELFLRSSTGSRFQRWKQDFALYASAYSSEQRNHLESEGYICHDIQDFQRWLTSHQRGPLGARPAAPKISGEE